MRSRDSRFISEWQNKAASRKVGLQCIFWEDDRHANHSAYSIGFLKILQFCEGFPWASILLPYSYLSGVNNQAGSNFLSLSLEYRGCLGKVDFC